MMFYAPARAMGVLRDRAPLGPALVVAFAAQGLFQLYVMWPYLGGTGGVTAVGLRAAAALLFSLIVFVPLVIFVANIVERRAGLGLALQQEFAPVAATVLYARAVAALLAFPLVALLRVSGGEAEIFGQSLKMIEEWQSRLPPDTPTVTALQLAESYAFTTMLPFFAAWLVLAVHAVFRVSWPRAVLTVLASGLVTLPLMSLLWPAFEWALASASPMLRILLSPFFLLMLFLLMRGYLGEVVRGRRARAAFKQNLKTATLNPADASAHYNLGLLYLQRRELEDARQSFERAVGIDADEVDSHYQLGRIARAEGRWADAIAHYGETLARDATHAQHEVWREAAATYVSAGQYADALDALERFLEVRQTDPEGLYLMGRAHAGLGRRREAVEWMQACIEAVRTSPAYKYRSEKRWLSEAQQFLRSLA